MTKHPAHVLALLIGLSSCATGGQAVHGPRGTPTASTKASNKNVKEGTAWCPEQLNTTPYYHPEQSIRPVRNQAPHKDHQPPETMGPGEGDVVFAKQNRYPVRLDYQRVQSRDLGAAYQIGSDEHVLTRVYPNQVTNGWEANPLGASPYYRDPECYNQSVNLAPGLQDKCKPIQQRPPQPTSFPPLTDEQRAALAAAQSGMPPLPSTAGKPAIPPKKEAAPLPADPKYCWGGMTPEKDGCVYPK